MTKLWSWLVLTGMLAGLALTGVAAGYGGFALARYREEAAQNAAFIQRLKQAEPTLAEIIAAWRQASAEQQRVAQAQAQGQAQLSQAPPQATKPPGK